MTLCPLDPEASLHTKVSKGDGIHYITRGNPLRRGVVIGIRTHVLEGNVLRKQAPVGVKEADNLVFARKWEQLVVSKVIGEIRYSSHNIAQVQNSTEIEIVLRV